MAMIMAKDMDTGAIMGTAMVMGTAMLTMCRVVTCRTTELPQGKHLAPIPNHPIVNPAIVKAHFYSCSRWRPRSAVLPIIAHFSNRRRLLWVY